MIWKGVKSKCAMEMKCIELDDSATSARILSYLIIVCYLLLCLGDCGTLQENIFLL